MPPGFAPSVVVCLALLAVPALPPTAGAHQSPASCTSTSPNVQFGSTDSDANIGIIHRNGDVVQVLPRVGNSNGANPCDLTDVTLTLSFPTPTGAAGSAATVATGVNLPSGTPLTDFPQHTHTAAFNDGVFRGPVTLAYAGVHHTDALHDTTPGPIGAHGRTLVISRPHATVTVTPSVTSGDALLPVTYTYAVANDSPLDPMDVPVDMFPVNLADDLCSPLTFTGGNTDNESPPTLDRGETWTYTCSRTLPGGSFTNTATLSGNSVRDGRPWPTATGQSTVNVNGPDMTIAKSHTGNFTQGDTGRTYTLVARNSGNRAGTGAVSVTDSLPAGLTATAISGSGWSCALGTLTCTRSDGLAAGGSYPPITVTVDVAGNAPASVANTATVTRAGENMANDSAADPTTIAAKPAPGGDANPGPGGPGGPAGPGAGGSALGPDTSAPSFAAARLTNRTFAIDTRGPSEPVVNAGARRGTSFVYTLSEPARVVFTIERKERGRRVGRTCRKPSRSNRRRKACVRYVKAGSFAQDGAAGANTRKWSGKIRSKGLKPGTYRASITAKDTAGNTSAVKRLAFKIVRR